MTDSQPQHSTRIVERILLIGLEGLEWASLSEAIQAGGLPTLAALLHSGVSGTLAVPSPHVSESAWTTLITGQRGHQHGVLHTHQPGEHDLGTVPIGRTAVGTATLGAILSEAGLTVHQVGWPVSHPVEQLRGIAVSDRFAREAQTDSFANAGGWPWVTPPTAAQELFPRRCQPDDIEEVTLAQLVPNHLLRQPALANVQEAARAGLAESMTLFRAARWCMQREPWDCTVCNFPALARLRQALPRVLTPEQLQAVGSKILAGCYEHLDMLLGQLIASAGEDTTIMLVGLDGSRLLQARLAVQSPSCHSTSQLPATASILDLTPTVLTLLGVPTAHDMDGRAWLEMFGLEESSHSQIDTWNMCVHPSHQQPPEAPNEYQQPLDDSVQHLLELGYTDPLETEAREQVTHCRRDTRRNRALSLLDAGKPEQAIEELEQITHDFPDWTPPRELLAEIHLQRDAPALAAKELECLIHRGEASARLYHLLGRTAAAQRDYPQAESHFHIANQLNPSLLGLSRSRGNALMRQREFESAKDAFRIALQHEGPSAPLLDHLATCCLGLAEYTPAIDYALTAIENDQHYALAHYHLGLALLAIERPQDAQQALEMATRIDRQWLVPLHWLERICRDYLHAPKQADAYQQRGRELIQQRRSLRLATGA